MNKGITLIELTLAMAIVVTALAIVISASGRNNDYRSVYNAARILQADMRYTQRRAVTEGRRFYVFFELENNVYHIGTRAPVVYYHTKELPYGVIFSPTSFNQNGNLAGFLPRGTPSQAGTIALQKGRYRRRLTVTPAGGRVEIQPVDIIGG
ncbi:MAG: type II secretion system GspH family protein [Defluviitaleaceae bacterium]|nr:type II secretion system GspH family protein [Defluviitaleaceae bacterium]